MKSLKYRITLWYSLFSIALTAMMLFAIVRIAHHNTDINVRDNLQITVNAVAEKTADPQNQNLEAMLKKEIDKKIIGIYNQDGTLLVGLQQSFQRERQFTQDASHELRTPISVILAQCELEMDGDMTREEYADAFSMIRRQTNKMHCLTENLLQLCRLESGHQKMDSQPFNLSSLVTELVEE